MAKLKNNDRKGYGIGWNRKRDLRIYQAVEKLKRKRGTYSVVAKQFGLSNTRVKQIVDRLDMYKELYG